MKSGTNWLGSLLNSHPQISCAGEFHWQDLMANFNANQKQLPLYEDPDFCEQTRCHLEEMIRRCLIEAADPNAIVIGDRTPHTISPITLRNVPHISIIRDGRDVLVSRAFHLYNHAEVHQLFQRIPKMAETYQHFQNDRWYFHKNPGQLLCHEDMVRESVSWWREHLNNDLSTVEQHPALKVLFVRYEDLHRNTEAERAKCFDFLDVDPQLAESLTGNLKPGFGEERPQEFFRKGAVGDWKNYFTDQTKQWFNDEAGEMLVQQGYTESQKW